MSTTISIIHPHHPHLSMHARLWANGINYINYQMTKPLAAEDVSPQPDSGHPCPFGWFGVESSGSGRGTWPQHPHLRSSVWILDLKWSKHIKKNTRCGHLGSVLSVNVMSPCNTPKRKPQGSPRCPSFAAERMASRQSIKGKACWLDVRTLAPYQWRHSLD